MHLKLLQKEQFKTGSLIGNKIADKITKVSRTTPKNSSETVTNKHNKEIPKERSLKERQIIVGKD